MNIPPASRMPIVIGGVSLILATILFGAVFSYLAAKFNYPEILTHAASDVLPALLALGDAGRAVWLLYGLIPLLLIPTARGVRAAGRTAAPGLASAAMWLALLSALAMMTGLLRWPTLHWSLAEQWTTASATARDTIAHQFALANLVLGNIIGEFLGELFLNGFFLAASLTLALAQPPRRWLRYTGIAASVLGWIAMLRNIAAFVAPLAALNNLVLPLWMLTLGIALILTRPSRR